MKTTKKVRNRNTSKSVKKEQVGTKPQKLFGQETKLPETKPKKQFNKLKFDKARKSVFGLK